VAGRLFEKSELREDAARQRDIFYQRCVGLYILAFGFWILDCRPLVAKS
jgi:hypothetical protein